MKMTIPLDGVNTSVEQRKVPVEALILDVSNPRIQYYLDSALNDQITQAEVHLALFGSNGQYDRLKDHIRLNRGIYNPIWIVPNGEYFRVIEGNTRALIYKELSDEFKNEPEWEAIESYILPYAINKEQINFIRLEKHLFGQTPWDAYEKARELHRLNTDEDYSIGRLQKLTKLDVSDIRDSIQAFRDMTDEYLQKYGKPGEQLKYSYFVEFRSNSHLKKLVRENKLTLTQFCDLVGNNKFGRGEEVRKLADVWENNEARDLLLRENMDSALDQLAMINPAVKSKLFEKIVDVRIGLERIGYSEWNEIKSGLHPAKVEELQKLHDVLTKQLIDIGIKK